MKKRVLLLSSIFGFYLQHVNHPGVVNLEEMFETPERVCTFLWLASYKAGDQYRLLALVPYPSYTRFCMEKLQLMMWPSSSESYNQGHVLIQCVSHLPAIQINEVRTYFAIQLWAEERERLFSRLLTLIAGSQLQWPSGLRRSCCKLEVRGSRSPPCH